MAKRIIPPKKILITRTDRLGDVILTTPVIENLRRQFPSCYIAFLCRPYTYPVLKGNPYLDEVIVYDKYGKDKGFLSTLKFAFYLRKKHFDWAIIFHPTARMHIITFLAGIPLRCGWRRKKKFSFLLNLSLPHTKQYGSKHELEYNFDLLSLLGVSVTTKNMYFPLLPEKREEVKKKLQIEGLNIKDKFVVIHPSASCVSKRWGEDKFSLLIKKILAEGIKVVVITSSEERDIAKKIIEENPVIDLRGKLDILEVGALLSYSHLFISNDSGPVHIAAALKIPVIVIFGRSDKGLSPLRWQPYSENSFYFHKDAGCQRCLAHNCDKNFLCLEMVGVDEVFNKAKEMLSSKFSHKSGV